MAPLACLPVEGGIGWLVDLALLWTCVSVLVVKKVSYETSDRTWKEFSLDSSKQFLGFVCSCLFTDRATGCSTYFAGTIIETTLGVLVEYLLLGFFSRVFREATGNVRALTTGEYYDAAGKFEWRNYVMQLVLWLFCVTLMKMAMMPVTTSYTSDQHDVAGKLLQVIAWSPHLEMVVVVLITPCAMQALQLWLTDDFIKKKGTPGLLSNFLGKVFGRPESVRRRTASMASSTSRSSFAPEATQPWLQGQAQLASVAPLPAPAAPPAATPAEVQAVALAAAAAAPIVGASDGLPLSNAVAQVAAPTTVAVPVETPETAAKAAAESAAAAPAAAIVLQQTCLQQEQQHQQQHQQQNQQQQQQQQQQQ
eukprot:CAMPEP_0183400246 /NCGR_PEP_ID=MMETSP0370-20130417/12472_1 /TAXON_ID=268820 /ORGANISM="Peridinium aciculiferum, Strain PAER-2" /LENGTH=364 /DNA_ID=CAMNT_0025581527 /DNA_START=93 /DNA_END=1185 /DNA_ORIENTATION=-